MGKKILGKMMRGRPRRVRLVFDWLRECGGVLHGRLSEFQPWGERRRLLVLSMSFLQNFYSSASAWTALD